MRGEKKGKLKAVYSKSEQSYALYKDNKLLDIVLISSKELNRLLYCKQNALIDIEE